MDVEEFRKRGREMVDYIIEYMKNIEERRVTPDIEPEWLMPLLPNEAPKEPESFDAIMKDVEKKIMPGVTHWQHPRFHAYFPNGNSYPSILADMLSDAIGCVGFSWASSPACTELEIIVMDWLAKALDLPKKFLMYPNEKAKLTNGHNSHPEMNGKNETVKSKGGGVIQGSASDCIYVCILAARAAALEKLKSVYPHADEGVLLSKLVAYCSKESHSCVQKGAKLALVKLRILNPDEKNCLRGETVYNAMLEDEQNGLFPFFVSTTLGTTSCCSFDNLAEIGPVCKEFNVWFHVDGAYAGNAFICHEFRYLMKGLEYADSFNTNVNKFMVTAFDCSCLWVADRFKLTKAFVVDPLYLQHEHEHDIFIDYRHWTVPLSRRFRSLKLWFVLRLYGISGIQKYIRNHCELARSFESKVQKDSRFEICNEVKLGLVCFRLRNENNESQKVMDEKNKKLLEIINKSGDLHMVPAMIQDKYSIRFCVTAQHANEEHIALAWKIIQDYANILENKEPQHKVISTAAYSPDKVSYFVQAVCDTKMYNPKVVIPCHSDRRPYSAVINQDGPNVKVTA